MGTTGTIEIAEDLFLTWGRVALRGDGYDHREIAGYTDQLYAQMMGWA